MIAVLSCLFGTKIQLIHLLEETHISDPQRPMHLLTTTMFLGTVILCIFFMTIRNKMQHHEQTVCFYESNCQQETISNIVVQLRFFYGIVYALSLTISNFSTINVFSSSTYLST
jgi:hypothetical protein